MYGSNNLKTIGRQEYRLPHLPVPHRQGRRVQKVEEPQGICDPQHHGGFILVRCGDYNVYGNLEVLPGRQLRLCVARRPHRLSTHVCILRAAYLELETEKLIFKQGHVILGSCHLLEGSQVL